ncbi:MAG: peptide chain release factor N(5)-glutamine methyltransferase [Methylocystis sp.]|nr:peptide chain release factor N(5)-glutamine methyltransferase [Methylocystis sp.]
MFVAEDHGLADGSAPTLTEKTTRAEAQQRVALFLERCGVAEARRDAQALLLAALGITPADLLLAPDAAIEASVRRLLHYAERRGAREPVSRILGRRGFWTLELAVAPEAFDPRPETETLVEAALSGLHQRRGESLAILDLGTGSGAIVCALLAEFEKARALAVDVSAAACAAAAANFARCGLADRAATLRGCWADAVDGVFDLVVSNPPYIRSWEIKSLAPEVALHDPMLALDGGADGLNCYRYICGDLPRLLSPRGLALLEIGAGQARDVCALLTAKGLEIAEIRCDIAGHERVVAARRPRPCSRDKSATLAI